MSEQMLDAGLWGSSICGRRSLSTHDLSTLFWTPVRGVAPSRSRKPAS